MQFSDTSNKNGVLQVCESLAGLGDGGITGNTLLLKNFVNYVNIAVAEVRDATMEVDASWKADDYNYTNISHAPITLVAGQRDYEMPVAATGNNVATLLRVNGIYILSGGERVYLRAMESNESPSTTNGAPTAFYFDGKSIFFECPPDATFVSTYTSFYVDYARLDDPFVSTDTTQQPGFLGTYHHILAFRAVSLYELKPNPQYALLLSSGDMERPGQFEAGLKRLKAAVSRMNGARETNVTSEAINHR